MYNNNMDNWFKHNSWNLYKGLWLAFLLFKAVETGFSCFKSQIFSFAMLYPTRSQARQLNFHNFAENEKVTSYTSVCV